MQEEGEAQEGGREYRIGSFDVGIGIGISSGVGSGIGSGIGTVTFTLTDALPPSLPLFQLPPQGSTVRGHVTSRHSVAGVYLRCTPPPYSTYTVGVLDKSTFTCRPFNPAHARKNKKKTPGKAELERDTQGISMDVRGVRPTSLIPPEQPYTHPDWLHVIS